MTSQLINLFAAEGEGGGSSIVGLLIILLPLGAILYMTIVPQRKARQRQTDMLRKLDVGDEVLTTGGIIGVITFAEDDIYHLEVDNDVVVRIAKTAVARSTTEADPATKPAARTRKGLLGSSNASSDEATTTDDAASSDDAADVDVTDDAPSPKADDDK